MKKRILIIEDDVAFGTMLNTWFSKNKWEPVLMSKVENAKQINTIFSNWYLPNPK